MLDPVHLANTSRFEEAAAALEAKLAQTADAAERLAILPSLGQLQLGLHLWDGAADSLSEAVARNPGDGMAWHRLAIACRRAGRHAKVIELCDTLAGVQAPPYFRMRFNLHRMRTLLDLGRREEASAALEAARASLPDHGEPGLWQRLLQRPPEGGPRLLSALAEPERFDRVRTDTAWAVPAHWVTGDFSRRYASFYADENFEDASFIVLAQDGPPLLRAECFAAGGLQGYEEGIRIIPAAGHRIDEPEARLAVDHLAELAAAFGGEPLVLDLPGATASSIGLACLKRKAVPETTLLLDLDLTAGDGQLWKCVRKSYRPLIKAGARTYEAKFLGRGSLDWTLFDRLIDLHYEFLPGGGGDRFFMSKPLLRQAVAEGVCELGIGFEGARPVSATMTVDEGDLTVYATGRYSRAATPDPSAWALWTAIERARERGRKRFRLGSVGPSELADEKHANIAFFKRGFADTVHYQNGWRLKG